MGRTNLLLRSEEMILLAIYKLGDNAYGVSIRRYLSEMTGQDWSIASVYAPLDRLTARGFVDTRDGAPTKERGGRRRRFYTLTRSGLAALGEIQRLQATMWADMPKLI